MKKKQKQSALFIHGGALGDAVLSLHLLAALRRGRFAPITVLGRATMDYLAKTAQLADITIDLEAGGGRLFAAEGSPLGRFDLVIDMLGLPAAEKWTTRYLSLDPRLRTDYSRHVTDQWFADLRAAGLRLIKPPDDVPLLPFRKSRVDGPVILHPGSGGRQKCWPLERFITLAARLAERGVEVEAVLGPVEQEIWSESEQAALKAALPVRMCESLAVLIEVLANCSAYVGNDSGPTHLAAAMGTPTIAIFGPTQSRNWGPLGTRAVVAMGDPDWPDVSDIADLLMD